MYKHTCVQLTQLTDESHKPPGPTYYRNRTQNKQSILTSAQSRRNFGERAWKYKNDNINVSSTHEISLAYLQITLQRALMCESFI